MKTNRAAVVRITLDFYGNTSLKTKRKELDSFFKDMKKKFNLSILEIDEFASEETCVVGFAAVIPMNWEAPGAQHFLDQIVEEMNKIAFTRITMEDTKIINY